MSGRHPPLTTDRRLAPGAVLRRGASAPYRAVEIIAGERHITREEFSVPDPASPRDGTRPLLSLVHVTDLQLADVQSPTRFEFPNRYFADPRYARIVPVQRPQEALTAHAIDATLRTLNAVLGPVTRMQPQLAVTTGDAIDNAQWNEMQNFLALFDGGRVKPDSGAPGYTGGQSPDWPDDIFWKPDGPGPDGHDIFRREFGFPHYPGLLARALKEFSATGLRMPWLSCFGNHEALHQGVATLTPALADALVGGKKPVGLAADFDHDRALELFTERPETFMAGPVKAVTPDPGRRPITRRDFVEAHFQPASRPFGHGFSEQNRLDGTAYYVHDTPAARFIALDTNCLAGGTDGCVDRDQARWLEARLAEVHSAYRGTDGREVRTGHDDRLVILFSHHGIDTLTSTRHSGQPGEGSVLGSGELLAKLHRFPNVVLWLNGHTHANAVRARRDPGNPAHGFWEVTTCAIIDWPCQARLVELIDAGGCLSIVCTMVDHDTPVAPRSLETIDGLASLHRELAANGPFGGAESAGIKPLFFYFDDGDFVFASELKSIRHIKKAALTINKKAIPYFLHLGFIPHPLTIYNNTEKFLAASFLQIDVTAISSQNLNADPKPFWRPESIIGRNSIKDEKKAKATLNSLLLDSVEKQLISDVPIGTFLSGGVDSSLVTAIASKVSKQKINSYSIAIDDGRFNESKYAQQVSRHLQTQHHEFNVKEKEVVELINELIPVFDEPFADSSAFPTMMVSRLAKKNVTVALSGDGGDELFMGDRKSV